MNENKMLVDDKLGEFVFRRAWIGSCPVTWEDRDLTMRIRLIASQGDVPTAAQKEALRRFVESKADTLQRCKVLLKPYCERVYGFLFKCQFEDEINLAVKFTGDKAEVGTDDILL